MQEGQPGEATARDTRLPCRYRYGFNGKEKDNEAYGEGDEYDYGFRIYDARLGKFLSVDPLTMKFPWWTPYQFAGNMPIMSVDIDGKEVEADPNANEYENPDEDPVMREARQAEDFSYEQNTARSEELMRNIQRTQDLMRNHLEVARTELRENISRLLARAGVTNTSAKLDLNQINTNLNTAREALKADLEINQHSEMVPGVIEGGELIGIVTLDPVEINEPPLVNDGSTTPIDNTRVNTPIDYSGLAGPKNVGAGKNFTKAQLERAKAYNVEQNNGIMRSDQSGKPMDPSKQSKKGVPANMNQVEGDHITAKSKGGNNSNENLRLINKEENIDKSNK